MSWTVWERARFFRGGIMDEDAYTIESAKSGLPRNYAIKEHHVFDILGKLSAKLTGRNDIVFKGGTALNKIYLGDVQRFSEDIDFDCFYEDKKEEKIKGLVEIVKEIEGYRVTRGWRLRETIRFELAYVLPNGQKDRVFVEFNLKKGSCPFEVVSGTAKSNVSGQTVAGILTYPLDVLILLKMGALISRGEGKDVYDVYYGLLRARKEEIDLGRNIKGYSSYSKEEMDYREMIERCQQKLEKLDWKKIQEITNPYIPYWNRPSDWEEFIKNLILILDEIKEHYKRS